MLILTKEREARGWSRAELGRRSRIHPATIGKVELGRLIPYEVEISRIARALDWQGDPDELLEEVGDADH